MHKYYTFNLKGRAICEFSKNAETRRASVVNESKLSGTVQGQTILGTVKTERFATSR